MEHLKIGSKRWLPWFLLIYILTGCAVLNVEVDVYKGPLANHRDIQLEQVAAMAVAARPLLLDLSYQLESKWRKENCGRVRYSVGSGKNKKVYYNRVYLDGDKMSDGTLRILCEQDLYRHSEESSSKLFKYHFADPGVSQSFLNKNTALDFDPNRYIYGSSEARKVNALLELYRDQVPANSILSQVVKKAGLIDEQLSIYRSSVPNQFWDDLVKGSEEFRLVERTKALNSEAREALKTCPDPWRTPVVWNDSADSRTKENSDIGMHDFSGLSSADGKVIIDSAQVFLPYKENQVICGLKAYFSPDSKMGWRVSRRFQRLLYQTALLPYPTKLQNEKSNKLVIPRSDADYFLSTNGTYLWLSEEKNALKIVNSVMDEKCLTNEQNACQRDEFVQHITSTARSFIESRISFDQLNRFLLFNIKYYSSINDGLDDRSISDSLIQLVKNVIDYSDFLLAFNEIKKVCDAENRDGCLGLANEYRNNLKNNRAFTLVHDQLDLLPAGECAMDIPFVYKLWRNSHSYTENGEILLASENKSRIFCGTSSNEDSIQKIISIGFRQYPVETAELILAIDSFLMEIKIGKENCYLISDEKCGDSRITGFFQKGPYEHRTGVVVGPNELLKEIKDNHSFANIAKGRLSTFSLGLKEGRRDRGLIDQIEYFLSQRDAIVSRSQSFEGKLYEDYPLEYKQTKALLLNSLEEFAQKLLVIANNNQLYSLDRLSDQTVSFQVVLQTVGNSILNYSNDITHQDSHEIRLAKRFETEKNALMHSIKRTDPKQFSLEELNKRYEVFLKKNHEKDDKEQGSKGLGDDELKITKEALAETYNKLKVRVESTDDNVKNSYLTFEKSLREAYAKLNDVEAVKKGDRLLDDFMLQQFRLAAIDPLNISETGNDPRSVIDSLILSMQYQYMMADLSGEPDRKALLKNAIKEAYEHRAGMIYIRPASAYLRSSYTASTLQPDGGTFDTNLLTDKWYTSIPFVGGHLDKFFNANEIRFNKVRNDIDKQNWQTVNKIRVKGSGKTNYVLIKDDVGNWYVKNYSEDKEEIFKSARNLLAFSTVGLGLDGLALLADELTEKSGDSRDQESSDNADQKPTAKTAPASTLDRFFMRQQSAYFKTSLDHYKMVSGWYTTEIRKILQQELEEVCDTFSMDAEPGVEFKWLEKSKPDKTYSYKNEIPLTSEQLKASADIGDEIVNAVRDVAFSMPAELNSTLKEAGTLCKVRESGQTELDDKNMQETREQVYNSSMTRITKELVKPFMAKRQAFVREQESTNLMMQDMLTE